jgi:membrane protease YdiL (CAAX protease family)
MMHGVQRFPRFLPRTLLALAVALVPQGIWSALIWANLKFSPRVPWAPLLIAILLFISARYLSRRVSFRAHLVTARTLAWAWCAGACFIVALSGAWIVLASLVRMPGAVLPDTAAYPWWTAALAITTGAALSPLCEQAGIWGYWQSALEQRNSSAVAIVLAALLFSILPHPPLSAAFWPKWCFFFVTGLTFAAMANRTNSILPGLAVHAVALLVFFVVLWPADATRPLVAEVGADAWVWMHVAQLIAFGLAGYHALGRVERAARPPQPVSVV